MGGYFSPVINVDAIQYYLIAVGLNVILLFVGLQKETPRLNVSYIILFAIGIVMSMFMAMIYHDQSLLSTAISQRMLYFLACFFVWWKIGLSEEELFPMLRVLTVVTIVVFVISLFAPQLFLSSTTIEKYMQRQSYSTDVLCFMPGRLYAPLYFFYLLQRLSSEFNRRDWFLAIAILGMFFVYQNRSRIIYLGIIFAYFLWTQRSSLRARNKLLIALSVAVILLLGLPYIRTISQSLIGETQEQLGDDEYARKVALQYYVFDYNKGSITRAIFGNGQPASGSTFLEDMEEGNENGAYWSDLGFIGDWFLFGILPIIAIIIMMIKVFKYPFPLYLKYLFASFLLVPTIHTFSGSERNVFYFSIVLYLFCYQERLVMSEILARNDEDFFAATRIE